MHRKWNWRLLGGWTALLWLAVTVAGYYVIHKPVSPALALALVRQIWQIMAAAILISIGGGLGCRLLPLTSFNPLSALSLQMALGIGLLSLGVLGSGYLGGYYSWVGLAAAAGLGILFRREIVVWWGKWGAFVTLWRSSSRFGKGLGFLCIGIAASALLIALAPPLKFDALVYHLALPRHYLAAHRFLYIPQIMYWGMPQTAEMIYTWAMAVGGLSAAPVLGWMVGLVALTGLLGLISQELGPDPAWVGVSALLAGFTLADGLSWGYNDWWTILFGLGCFVALSRWKDTDEDNHLALAGILAGIAVGTKYTAGLILLSGIVVIVLHRKAKPRRALRSLLWFSLPALFIFSPWLVKNILATGNPVYPLLVPSGAMTTMRLDLYQGGAPWGNWLDVFLLPVRATYYGLEGAPGYSASIGPLLLGLGFAAALGWRKREQQERSKILLAAQIGLTGILTWMIAGRFSSYLLQSRLYLSLFPMLAFLAAAGYAGLRRTVLSGVRLGVVSGFLIFLVLGLNFAQVWLHQVELGSMNAVSGLRCAEDYLADNLGWHQPAMDSINKLPSGSRVLMLWEPRSLYCLPNCDPDEILDRWLRARYESKISAPATAREILDSWKTSGFSHLLYFKLGADFEQENNQRYIAEDWQELDDLLTQLEPLESFGETYTLYRISP